MQVCFLLSRAPSLPLIHIHVHGTPTPDFPTAVLPLSPPLSHPTPCKVMRGLICKDHLCPLHSGSEMWSQEGGKKQQTPALPFLQSPLSFLLFRIQIKIPRRGGVSSGDPNAVFLQHHLVFLGCAGSYQGLAPSQLCCLARAVQAQGAPSQTPRLPGNLCPPPYST